jgi:two-component system sensor histidine kinase YesM
MQKAELEVLREQINPHFLYNTLGTIADLALQNSADEVYDAIETLGNFYRRFLSKGSKEITIREEVAIVRDYLKLQKLRYEDVFEDEYDLQEDLLDIKIPKLILQPLVENSLYHGVRLKGEKGIIRVSVYEKDQRLHIVVYDSGVGMNPEQIQSLMNENNNKSFGLKGTIERIRYYYDMDDVFEIRSKEGEYCEVDIKIPL